jgi:hypothetical protein
MTTSDEMELGECYRHGWHVETSNGPTESNLTIMLDSVAPKGWPHKMLTLRVTTFSRVVKELSMTAEQAENMASLLVAAAAEARK